jgi:hypothetical protein
MSTGETVEQILDLARWAPSGDNTQPWRFECVDDFNVVVHGFDTRDHCVYDLDGRASQISLGALLETMSIAASGYGRTMVVRRRAGLPDTTPTFDVGLHSSSTVARDVLFDGIRQRTVQRRPMPTRRLMASEKAALEQAVAPRFQVQWLEGFTEKWKAASLMFRNAKVRLTMPEAYEVHRAIIEWDAQFSEDKVPDAALGAGPFLTKFMRFGMKSWQRVSFFNRYLAGTFLPRLQMDFAPGLACAGHYVLVDEKPPQSIDDHVAAGRAVQRFWLTLTNLGLQQQPEMTPLLFEAYVRHGIAFTQTSQVTTLARHVAGTLRGAIGVDPARAVWMGRVAAGAAAQARSTRLPLSRLEWTQRS